MTERADHPEEPGWQAALDFGLSVIADLPRARVSVTADRVAVSAVSASPAEKRRLEADFARRAPPGLRLTLDIAAPRPVIAPFTLRFVIDEDGPRFDACSADDQAAAGRILAAAVAAGALGRLGCTIGLGVPSPAWGQAAAMGIAALAELGAGTLTFADADVTLIAPHTVPSETFERVAGELKARLPEVFSLRTNRLDPPVDETAQAARPAPEFTAVLTREGRVELRGRLADERMRDAVEAFARIRFGADAVTVATRLDAEVPDGWPVRVLAGLAAMGETVEGSLRVRPDSLELTGVTGNRQATEELSRLLSERLGPGADFRLALRYDRRFDPEAALMPPAECIGEIAAIQSEQKITFAPGSAQIDAGARAALDAIAEVLRGCGPIALEIAGHTDSQGRAESNQRLSQQRAEAVLAALRARRIPVDSFVARGYGADDPIADNRTEAGREANRRIEFRLVPGSEATAEASPAAEAPPPAAPPEAAAEARAAPAELPAAARGPDPEAPPEPAPNAPGAPSDRAAPEEPAALAGATVEVQTPGPGTPRPRPRPARN
jgi:OOP family OmpA-OmpF porin